MTTRRTFIQNGSALGAAAAAGSPAFAWNSAARPDVLGLTRVAFDSRFPDSLQFAAEARRLGAVVHDTRGDVTSLYVDHLLETWRTSPAAVAGLTTYPQLFALRTMAEGAGLRLIYAAHHSATGGHEVFGPRALAEQISQQIAEHRNWGGAAAHVVMRWPLAHVTVTADRSSIAAADEARIGHGSLLSWVLAPIRRFF
jgi:hypothetical protein